MAPDSPPRSVDFSGQTFRAPEDRTRFFTQLVLRHVPTSDSIRILDVGCGAGDQALALASEYPGSRIVGVDLSGPSIALAESRRVRLTHTDRVEFRTGDYLDFRDGTFDLILSISTLQLIPVAAEQLAAKVASDLAPGGRFINAMPYRCGFNMLLSGIRRTCRVFRGRLTDRLLLEIGRALHGREFSDELLLERIPYAYHLPAHYDPDMRHTLERQEGLRVIEEIEMPQASLAQLKHRVTVLRKMPSPADRQNVGDEPSR